MTMSNWFTLIFQAENGDGGHTPAKSILKTPGSTKKGKSVVFAPSIRQSPRHNLFNKENSFNSAEPIRTVAVKAEPIEIKTER